MAEATLFRDPEGGVAQLFNSFDTPRRAQVTTAGTGSTAATPLPSGINTISTVVEIRTTGPCYINFGTDAVSASAAATSQLFPAGEKVQMLPPGVTHFAIVRIGADDVTAQVELLR